MNAINTHWIRNSAAILLWASPLLAQGVNVDVGQNLIFWPEPDQSYGAGSGQSGHWNRFPPVTTPTAIAELSGASGAITLVTTNTSSVNVFPSVITTAGDQELMEDFQWSGGLGEIVTFRFEGLMSGLYDVYTYGIDPVGGSDQTQVTVLGSSDPAQVLSGPWLGNHSLGGSYARHRVGATGGVIEIELAGIGAFPNDRTVCNGIQLVPVSNALGTPFCMATPNSSGVPGVATASGSDQVGANAFFLTASALPMNQFGYFLTSQTAGAPIPGLNGNLCLQLPIGRFSSQVMNSGAAGEFTIQADLTAFPVNPAVAVQPGETWFFQCWYRDVNPTPTSNFTGGVSVQFQ